jgi:uncharacterized membrane protein
VLSSLAAGAGMGAVAYTLAVWIRAGYHGAGLTAQAADALVPILAGIVVYLGLAYALRSEELRFVIAMLPRRAG